MAKLLGILNDGIGGVISHAKIILTAQHNSAKVLKGTQSIIDTDSQGAYSFTVQPNHYTVALRLPEGSDLILGSIVVNSDSINGTLNDFLLTPNDVSIITPEILLQIQQCRTEAQHAAEQAITAERNAAKTLEGAVKIAGDRMTGNLAIKRDDATITVLNNSNAGMAIKAEPSGNVSFNAVTDGNQQLKWYYNKISNQVIFSNLNDVQINSKSVLKQGEAAPFTSMKSHNNTKVQYKKLAEIFAFNANDEVKKVSFIISGGNSRVDKHNSLDFITFGVDGDKVHLAHQILSDSTSSANRLKVGWYYNKSTSSYELWLRFNRFRGAFGITRVSGISVGTTEYITDNVTEKITMEDKEISFVEPVLNLTTANLNNYLSSATILYHGGTQSKPALLSKGQKIVIDNPSKSLNIQVQVELLINNIWGIATEPNVWNNSGNWYSSGVWVNVSEASITITTSITGLASNVTPNAWGATTNLLEAPYRLRIIKMGE